MVKCRWADHPATQATRLEVQSPSSSRRRIVGAGSQSVGCCVVAVIPAQMLRTRFQQVGFPGALRCRRLGCSCSPRCSASLVNRSPRPGTMRFPLMRRVVGVFFPRLVAATGEAQTIRVATAVNLHGLPGGELPRFSRLKNGALSGRLARYEVLERPCCKQIGKSMQPPKLHITISASGQPCTARATLFWSMR